MEQWRRPALCRLCRFPAGADGVPVSRLDAGKLSRWWPKALLVERDVESSSDAHEFICQFCLWDAKILGDAQGSNSSCAWWLGEDTNIFYKKYYFSEQIIRQCSITISPLPGGPWDSTAANGGGAKKMWDKRGIATGCLFCEEVFKSRRAAYKHMRLEHEDRSRIKCGKCDLIFCSSAEKTEHLKIHFFKCHICLKKIKHVHLQQHIDTDHEGILDSMECCGKQYLSLNHLTNHFILTRPTVQRECVYCKMVLHDGGNLRIHVKRRHASKAICCPYYRCVNYFTSQEEKEMHLKDAHESKSDLIKCIYCNIKKRRMLLPRHVDTWHKSVSYRCEHILCLTYFHSEKEKSEHELKWHMATKVAPGVDCIYCGKKLDWKDDVRQHVLKKHKNVAIRCKSRGCGMYFLTDEDRDTHTLEKHAEEEAKRKWKCSTCDFRTNSERNLNNHELRHKPKNIKCPQCPKLCTAKRTLQMHINSDHPKATFCIHCKAKVHVKMWHHLRVRPCERCKLVTPCMGVKKAHTEICTGEWPRCRI